jgi:hypothetical protein
MRFISSHVGVWISNEDAVTDVPTYKFVPIAAPPTTCSAPVLVLVGEEVEYILTTLSL